MYTCERLSDEVFNVLPMITCYILYYFLCVLSGKNIIEELCHILVIRKVFLWRY